MKLETWEIVKALKQDSSKEFQCDESRGSNSVSIKDGVLCWKDGTPFTLNIFTPIDSPVAKRRAGTIDRYVWTEVKEPVDFMTVYKAWQDDKTVYLETNYGRREFKRGLFDGDFDMRCVESGMWYIKD